LLSFSIIQNILICNLEGDIVKRPEQKPYIIKIPKERGV